MVLMESVKRPVPTLICVIVMMEPRGTPVQVCPPPPPPEM